MHQQDVVAPGPFYQAGKKTDVRTRTGGVVGIVKKKSLGSAANLFGDILQLRQESIFFQQGHFVDPAAGQQSVRAITRIAGIGGQNQIAGIDHRHHKVVNSLL